MNQSVSLVLGSGGARGLAHIGVIRWLEQNGYQIKSISGCSAGALIGGVYAAGKLDQFEQWVLTIDNIAMAKLLDISWQSSGLFKGDKIINNLIELIGDTQIEQLNMPFTAVAANITEGKEVWLNSGRLFDAIRASISLPLFFTPFEVNGELLVDGGVLNPVPIAPTFGDKTDFTLSVNLGGELMKNPLPTTDKPHVVDSSLQQKLFRYLDKVQDSIMDKSRINFDAFDVANKSFDAMQSCIARQKLAAYPPDVSIDIPQNLCGTFEFELAEQVIEFGYNAANETFKNQKS